MVEQKGRMTQDDAVASEDAPERLFRARIYARYNSARAEAQVSRELVDLMSRAPYLRRLVSLHFPAEKSATILDVGCGYGALVHFAREFGYHNTRGVDGAPEQVAMARQLGVEGVEAGDLRQVLKLQPDNSLDVVSAFDVLEHFTRDELLFLVDQVLRVLKPGGRWIIHTPNGESPFFGAIRYGDITHEIAFTDASLSQLLLSSGFGNVNCYEDAPVVHGVKSAIRWMLWRVLRNLLRFFTAVETGQVGGVHIFSRNLLAIATK